jgi:peptidoglycan/xylan/chitin deacetylase (PgdA/CDA1 family)
VSGARSGGGAAIPVLMYHAVHAAGAGCAGADPHYAVSVAAFDRHVALMRASGMRISSVASILARGGAQREVAVTFDDGHSSNGAAAERLHAAGGSADFFVNASLVGSADRLDWPALRDLAAAGMSIQSHGYTHRYLNELLPGEVEHELAASKAMIEDRLGAPVTLFAPPGGRLAPGLAELAARLGYQGLCTSSAGLWPAGGSAWGVPRLAVLASTSDERLHRWIEADRWEIGRMRARHEVLRFAKGLLGNAGYEGLRRRLLRAPKPGSPGA